MFRTLTALLLFITLSANGQGDQVWLHPNRGQWDDRILYKADLHSGQMLIEQKGLTYYFHNFRGHSHDGGHQEETPKSHTIRMHFLGGLVPSDEEEKNLSAAYRNYFLGNDPSKWKSGVLSAGFVRTRNNWPGVDMEIEAGPSSLKYSWIVAPGVSTDVIRWNYDGADQVRISDEGNLVISHSFGYITESQPVAWIIHNGHKKAVDVKFKVENGIYGFSFEGNTSFSDTLIIDPSLTFSTFTGSTADNWGFTAAPDDAGNLAGGGIVFGVGYPITTGAADGSFNGGAVDVGITKFTPNGTSLIYSTYIGGSDSETCHSIISNSAGELYIFGITGSINFPIAGSPYDASFNGGTGFTEDGITFTNGSDIYVARLNASGTALLGTTYVGGSNNDGLCSGTMNYNYGDAFRGEIVTSPTAIYVASSTLSTNFPTAGAASSSSGAQDAVIFSMSLNLSSMNWSRYFGTSGFDTGNGIQVSTTGDVYVAGGISGSVAFPLGHDLSYNNSGDGYLLRLNGGTGAIMSGTYIGTGSYDQAYFVQLSQNNNVHVFGQTDGSIPISPGCYGNANSGQFVAQYSPNLVTQNWVTVIGAGTGFVEISPTAFLVSNCDDIYLSGWGGFINSPSGGGPNVQATNSTSTGFPVTSDAYQPTTNGSNFWIGVLSANAQSLKYATFMGGSASSYNHVDGGTSRFDKNGSIYHAVCGACSGNPNGFTSTPGVWSETNNSANCNLAAFKFELSSIEAIAAAANPIICLPDPVVFENTSVNGDTYHWYFGDGDESTLEEPTHVYPGPGVYTVKLVVTDADNCFSADSVEFEVTIEEFNGGVTSPLVTVCPGDPAQLEAYGGDTYTWTPAVYLNNPNIADPIATVNSNTTFMCVITDFCGTDTVYVDVSIMGGTALQTPDTNICIGNSVQLQTSGLTSVSWSPPTYLNDASDPNPVSTPTATITYIVTGTTASGCGVTDTVTITVSTDSPTPVMPDTLTYCFGTSGAVTVSGAEAYTWTPNTNISPATGPSVVISAATEGYYYCDFGNACDVMRDSIWIDLLQADVQSSDNASVCSGAGTVLTASGAVTYAWTPAVTSQDPPVNSQVFVSPLVNTQYMVVGRDKDGCYDTAYVQVSLYPTSFVQTSADVYASPGDMVELTATASNPGSFMWTPPVYLSCTDCATTYAQPDQNFQYTVHFTDANGCVATDVVEIIYDALIYVPNTFTPNDNQFNNVFFAQGVNVVTFSMNIFNRWGEIVFTATGINDHWDGTYRGNPCQDGVYTWKITYTDLEGERHEMTGHVSLLR